MAINNDKCIGETVNLGTGFEISIEKLINHIVKKFQIKMFLLFLKK